MPDSAPPAKICPQCGAAVPAGAPEGLCPRCVASLNLSPDTAMTGAAEVAAQPAPTPGEIAAHFPQLEVIEFLGRGGMGVVYKARQKALGRLVALKLLAPERVDDPKFAERFAHEAKALAALSHPSIVTIHDFGQAGGYFYLLMEFVDGVNLRQAMQVGRFTPEQALAIVPPVCEALQYAHEHGVVHRDIKPENLLLDKTGRVKIADFGIAKMLHTDGPESGSAESQPAGTPQYMAPEQKEHRATDQRTDIYSLGVVLYELLTGELPADKLQPPSRKVQIDVRLDEIVLRALEKTPERRYQTAVEFRTQVEIVTHTPAAPAPDETVWEAQCRTCGQSRPLAQVSGIQLSASHRERRMFIWCPTCRRPRLAEVVARAAAPAPPQGLKASTCYVSTPEQLGAFESEFFLYRRKGQVLLDAHQLVFVRDDATTAIPLTAIRDLSIGHYPRVVNPAGLDFISVTYEEGGQPRRLFFSPSESLFGMPWRFNQFVAAWFEAIRRAIVAATGREPGRTPADQLGVPSASLAVVATRLVALLAGAYFISELLWINASGGSGPGMSPFAPMVFSIVLGIGGAVALRSYWRRRSAVWRAVQPPANKSSAAAPVREAEPNAPPRAEPLHLPSTSLAVFSLLLVALLSGGVLLWELLSAGPGPQIGALLKTPFGVVLLLLGAGAAATLHQMRRRNRVPGQSPGGAAGADGEKHGTSGCLWWVLAAGGLTVAIFAAYFSRSAQAPPAIPIQPGDVARKIDGDDWLVTLPNGQVEIHRKGPDGKIQRRIIVAPPTPARAVPPVNPAPPSATPPPAEERR